MELLGKALTRITADLEAELDRFEAQINSQYPVSFYVYTRGDDAIELSKIVVEKKERKSGIGTEIMEKVAKFADEKGLIVHLDPSTDHGATSVNRLKKFYSRFGFVPNKGRNEDYRFRGGMIRHPSV